MNRDLGAWTSKDCALMLIGYQKEMVEVIRSETSSGSVDLNVRLLAKAANASDLPIVSEDALVLTQELAAAPGLDQALACYASRRLPRTRHVQQATAMRNSLAALTLQDRTAFVIPKWAELSTGSFAALVPEP